MTHFWLVRHGDYEMIDHGLGGRAPYGLNEAGLAQAELVASRLAGRPIKAVIASPVRRAVETATPLARRLGLDIVEEAGFAEIDFGSWTGKRFDELHGLPAWVSWNRFRSTAPVPDGESMLTVQARAVFALCRLAAAWPGGELVVFSHADVIKSALLHFLGAPLDLMSRLRIAPASLSQVALDEADASIIGVNEPPGGLPPAP